MFFHFLSAQSQTYYYRLKYLKEKIKSNPIERKLSLLNPILEISLFYLIVTRLPKMGHLYSSITKTVSSLEWLKNIPDHTQKYSYCNQTSNFPPWADRQPERGFPANSGCKKKNLNFTNKKKIKFSAFNPSLTWSTVSQATWSNRNRVSGGPVNATHWEFSCFKHLLYPFVLFSMLLSGRTRIRICNTLNNHQWQWMPP